MSVVVPAVYAAIAKVQKALSREGVGKERSNQQQGYKFRGIDDVMNHIAPHLADAGLCILPRFLVRHCADRQTQRGGSLFSVVLEAEFDFVAVIDGSKHTVRVYGEAMDSADKATNKAMSAAYKYACLQVFCIPTEGDNDPDATTHEVRHEPGRQPVKQPDLGAWLTGLESQAVAQYLCRKGELKKAAWHAAQTLGAKGKPDTWPEEARQAARVAANAFLEIAKAEAIRPISPVRLDQLDELCIPRGISAEDILRHLGLPDSVVPSQLTGQQALRALAWLETQPLPDPATVA